MRSARALGGALILAAVAPAAAFAAWSQPTAPFGPTPHAETVTLLFDGRGAGLATWWSPQPPDHEGPTSLAIRSPGATWTRPRTLTAGYTQRYGHAGLVIAPSQYPPRRGLRLRILDSQGKTRRRFVLDPHHLVSVANFATSPGGRTAAVWDRRPNYKGRGAVMLARPATGRPVVVAPRQRSSGEAVAVNDRGDVLVAWTVDVGNSYDHSILKARLVRADGRRGPVKRLASVRGFSFIYQSVALTSDGRGAVAWGAQNADGDQIGLPAYAAQMRRDGRFLPRRRLTKETAIGKGRYGYDLGRISVVATRERELVVAWTDGRPHFYAVRAATLERGRLARIQTLSAPQRDGQLRDLAADPSGVVRALWTSDWDESEEMQDFFDQQEALDEESATPVELLVAERSLGGSFGLPERVSSDADRRPIPAATLAFDPRQRRPWAAWIDGLDERAELRTSGR